ncbi:PspC domain-containing protein [Planctomonas sp. JC2975]|uniref:PspC domain-containing protein n=1 Tax=Planctomonas sp. JC2975 TaxID=2729626 RepID=UPI001F0FB559|nr:PspC domain-containing protein [Planctomonas sp. JC2975]
MRPRDSVLGGVCIATARHLGWGVTATRWLAVGLALCGGAGILLYGWLWALTPLEPEPDGTHGIVHRRVSVPWVLVALAVVFALIVFGLGGAYRAGDVGSATLLPAIMGAIVFGAAAVVWDQLVDAQAPRTPTAARWLRVSSGAVLVAVGFLGPFAWGSAAPGWAWLLFVAALLAGVAVLAGPWALRLWRELIAERTKRVREEERAEMAAHLHDSVLQTLALIQTRAGASSEVARLARAQERELREWLYSGEARADSDLVSDLRDVAAALELDYPVRFDIVAVGETSERSSGEVAAAAREAMANAARHAGGDVSVYIESTATSLDVFVRDRGPGFSLDGVPADRMGVRESILGRMRRAGGTASVRTAEGEGTEVRLHYDYGEERA